MLMLIDENLNEDWIEFDLNLMLMMIKESLNEGRVEFCLKSYLGANRRKTWMKIELEFDLNLMLIC